MSASHNRGDERMDELWGRIREAYNAPPPTPREEMWSEIEARLVPRDADIVDLEMERQGRLASARTAVEWAAAAAAVLLLGIAVGRVTAPGGAPKVTEVEAETSAALSYVTAEHLERSEMLLRMVRSDARQGGLDPVTRRWAQGLLTETRLLLDAGGAVEDPSLADLLEDLELVLVQIVGAAQGEGRAQDDLGLALRGLEEREVLSRIQAVTPQALPGT